MYKEEVSLVKSSFQLLAEAAYPGNKMLVVLAVEERGGEEARKRSKQFKTNSLKNFFNF